MQDPKDGDGRGENRSPLLLAIERGMPQDKIIELIDRGEPIDVKDVWGNMPLHYAALWGADLVAGKLLEMKADPRAKVAGDDEYNGLRSPVELAAAFGQEATVLNLLNQSDWTPEELETALYAASAKNSEALDEILQKTKFSERAVCKALDEAVRHGHIVAVTKVLEHKDILADMLSAGMVETLRHGKSKEDDDYDDIMEGENIGRMMLFKAVKFDFPALAAYLISIGCDPGLGNLQSSKGNSTPSPPVAELQLSVKGPGVPLLTEKGLIESLAERSNNLPPNYPPFALAIKRKEFVAAISMLPAAFLVAPGTVLYASLCISEAATQEEKRVQVTDPLKAREMAKQATRAQVMGLQLLQTLPESRQLDLIRSKEGELYLRLAAKLDIVSVLSQPVVQSMMKDRWHGALLMIVNEGKGVSRWGDKVEVELSQRLRLALFAVVVAFPANMLAMVIVAVFPPAEALLLKFLRALGEQGENYALIHETGYSPTFHMWYEEFWLLGKRRPGKQGWGS